MSTTNVEQLFITRKPIKSEQPSPRHSKGDVIGVYEIIKPLRCIRHLHRWAWVYKVKCTNCGTLLERNQKSIKLGSKACKFCYRLNRPAPEVKKKDDLDGVPDFITMPLISKR